MCGNLSKVPKAWGKLFNLFIGSGAFWFSAKRVYVSILGEPRSENVGMSSVM